MGGREERARADPWVGGKLCVLIVMAIDVVHVEPRSSVPGQMDARTEFSAYELDTMDSDSATKPSPVHAASLSSPTLSAFLSASASFCRDTRSVCVVKYGSAFPRNSSMLSNSCCTQSPSPIVPRAQAAVLNPESRGSDDAWDAEALGTLKRVSRFQTLSANPKNGSFTCQQTPPWWCFAPSSRWVWRFVFVSREAVGAKT